MNKQLIDFDGVVYNNRKTFEHINAKSIQYISQRLQIPHHQASRLNAINYKKRGHTVFATSTPIDDYNDYVFDTHMLTDVLYNVYDEEDTVRLRNLMKRKELLNLDLILCTNAPMRYCIRVLELSGYTFHDMFSSAISFTSDSVNQVKPSLDFFNHVHFEIEKNGITNEGIRFYDDSTLNINTMHENMSQWKPVLFDSSDETFQSVTLD